MSISVSHASADASVVQIAGEIGLTALLGDGQQFKEGDNALDSGLRAAVPTPPPVVVLDLTDASYICSLGIGTLMRFRKSLAAQQADVRVAATGQLVTLLKLGRLDQLLPVFPTVAEATKG